MDSQPAARASQQDGDAHLLRPRPYQIEMLEESLKRNVIVAMETGSGKTLVAVLRIQAELQRCPQHQMVWFLAPKVALAEQQAKVLNVSLPSYEQRFLCGADGVDKWSKKHLWDAVLKNVRIVVCTPAVLRDALGHGFVDMVNIALLVLDEAHRCTGKDDSNQIMKSSYWHRKSNGQTVPSILALTASPVRKANERLVREIEANLDATIATPTLHRVDLQVTVNRPETSIRIFQDASAAPMSPLVQALREGVFSYDLHRDPEVLERKRLGETMHSPKLSEMIMKRKTACLEQLKKLLQRATELESGLGSAMAEWYLRQCAANLKRIRDLGNLTLLADWKDEAKRHLLILMESYGFLEPAQSASQKHCTSAKYRQLLQILRDECTQDFTCIVFAKQRATVAALAELLSAEQFAPRTLRIGSFVGSSSNVARSSDIYDLADLQNQQASLEGFRSGLVNIVVSTDVLEEGIDVPACNLVICYDPPSNLISFVQRRGRARQELSRYILLFPSESASINEWQRAEHVLTQTYADEERRCRAESEREAITEPCERELRNENTSALLTLEKALSHLYHFCSTLRRQYVDPTPVFTVKGTNTRAATVQLPATLPHNLRLVSGTAVWQSEKRAKQDAAFEACRALYHEGLINEHFLPASLEEDIDTDLNSLTQGPAIMQVKPALDPWQSICQEWQKTSQDIHCGKLKLHSSNGKPLSICVLLPQPIPEMDGLKLIWDDDETFEIEVRDHFIVSRQHLTTVRNAAATLLRAAFKNQGSVGSSGEFVALFIPDIEPKKLAEWTSTASSYQRVAVTASDSSIAGLIVYDRFRSSTPHIAIGTTFALPTHDMNPEARDRPSSEPQQCLQVRRLPKLRDFRKPIFVPEWLAPDGGYTGIRLIPAQNFTTNQVSADDIRPACFIPVLTHHIHNVLIAKALQQRLLPFVTLSNTDLVLQAITTGFADDPYNYERLEFLGDCVLKMLVVLQLMAEYPKKPESRLTDVKSRLVSNGNLAWTACQAGLDRYIIQQRFLNKAKHQPYIKSVLEKPQAEGEAREMSTKVLADVTEALIGVAYLEGLQDGVAQEASPSFAAGLAKAIDLLKVLMPGRKWKSLGEMKDKVLHDATLPGSASGNTYHVDPSDGQVPSVEHIIGHDFEHKSLIDSARTHPSFTQDMSVPTYDRLEFLGDALLDLIVTTRVFLDNSTLPHYKLHNLRQACVNRDILAYIAMGRGIDVARKDVTFPSPGQALSETLTLTTLSSTHQLWHFMRRNTLDTQFSLALKEAQEKYDSSKVDIDEALTHTLVYPWADLMSIGAPKSVSDMIESCLAAIWLDTDSSTDEAFAKAESMLDHFGLMQIMRHLAADNVEVVDPKQRLHILALGEKVVIEHVDEGVAGGAFDYSNIGQRTDEKTITCVVAGVEVARMQITKITRSEALDEEKVSAINQYRLCDKVIMQWNEPGGGAEVVKVAKSRRAQEKKAEKEGMEDVKVDKSAQQDAGSEGDEEEWQHEGDREE